MVNKYPQSSTILWFLKMFLRIQDHKIPVCFRSVLAFTLKLIKNKKCDSHSLWIIRAITIIFNSVTLLIWPFHFNAFWILYFYISKSIRVMLKTMLPATAWQWHLSSPTYPKESESARQWLNPATITISSS